MPRLRSLFSVLLFTVLSSQYLPAAEPARPNILLILADDMGYGDPHCFNPNSKIATPAIDRLAGEGIRFTDAHAPGAVCVPSRYGLLTGRYPFRATLNVDKGPIIEAGRMTIGTLLQKAGYRTACVGKWHQGLTVGDYAQPIRGGPFDRGFDRFFGIPASLDIPPYYLIENDRAVAAPSLNIAASSSEGWSPIQGAFWREGKVAPGFKHADVLDMMGDRAIDYLRGFHKAQPAHPFFLYLALPAPHTPWLPGEAFKGRSGAGMYGDYAMQVDATIARVLKALDEELKLREDTLVFFTSDNGPVWYPADVARLGHDATGGFRGMKGDAWEGGHRMPFAARWPGHIKPGSTSDQTICFTDFLATFAALTGQQIPADAGEDSFNMLPALLQSDGVRPIRDATIVQSSRRVLAIRQGPWKLIPQLGSGGFTLPATVKPQPGEPAGQLYNLQEDPGEKKNLYAAQGEIVDRLSKLLKKYQADGRSR
jgi:arylsulfatase A-like enzyme